MNGKSSAFFPIPVLHRQTSATLAEKWNDITDRQYPDEYLHAASMVCLRNEWVPHTKLARYLREIDKAFKADPVMKSLMDDEENYQNLVFGLVKYAYNLNSVHEVHRVRDVLTNQPVVGMLSHLHRSIGWRRPYLAYTIGVLSECTSRDLIIAKLGEVCDRAGRCASAQRQAFNILLSSSFYLREQQQQQQQQQQYGGATTAALSTEEEARVTVMSCFEDYLDDHKDRAFNSSFLEPSRYYFDCVHDTHHRDHVNIHAFNYYAALVNSTLGFQLPVPPQYSDGDNHGVVSFWEGLSDEAWELFSRPEHFGVSFEGISPLLHPRRLKQRVQPLEMPTGSRVSTALVLANSAVEPGDHSHVKSKRQHFAVYIERFAYFFSREFFLRKLFEALYSECKPEFMGARNALNILYEQYRAEKVHVTASFTTTAAATTATTAASVAATSASGAISEESLVEHVYTDDSYMYTDNAKLGAFFAWLGVAKITAADEALWTNSCGGSSGSKGTSITSSSSS